MAAQGFTKIRCSLFEENDYIKIAEEVSDWIEEYSVESEQGKYWKQSPETDHNYDYEALFTPKSLYGGSAGTAIFYIRLYQVTGNAKYLNEAKAAFEYIANTYEGPDFYDFSQNPQSNAENAWNIEGFITGLYNGPAGGGVLAEYL